MLFNNVLKVVVAALLLHYDCFATFYEHALQHVFEEFALFGGTLSHIMLANSHCAKKTNYHFKTNKLPVLMNNPWLLLTLLSDCEFPAALVGSGARWSTSEIYHLEVYMAFSPGIHSFWQYLAFFHVLWHSIWHSIWRLYWHTFCMVFILSFFQAFYLGSILTFYLSGIFSGVHSGRILTFFLAHVSGT